MNTEQACARALLHSIDRWVDEIEETGGVVTEVRFPTELSQSEDWLRKYAALVADWTEVAKSFMHSATSGAARSIIEAAKRCDEETHLGVTAFMTRMTIRLLCLRERYIEACTILETALTANVSESLRGRAHDSLLQAMASVFARADGLSFVNHGTLQRMLEAIQRSPARGAYEEAESQIRRELAGKEKPKR